LNFCSAARKNLRPDGKPACVAVVCGTISIRVTDS
jgi:hypothetical protein